jgi:hypothetical protein
MTDATTTLINQALAHMGEDPVNDAGADPAPERLRKVLPWFHPSIEAVLKRHAWRCALEYGTLTPSADVPANWKWKAHYVAPEGCLKLWAVDRATAWERGRWVRDDGAVLEVIRAAEDGPLNIAWVAKRRPEAIDSHVLDAIALEMAARACETISGSEARGDKLRSLARDALLSAIGLDGADSGGDEGPIPDRVADLRATAL